jgi:hypothetical protein
VERDVARRWIDDYRAADRWNLELMQRELSLACLPFEAAAIVYKRCIDSEIAPAASSERCVPVLWRRDAPAALDEHVATLPVLW